MNRQTIRLDISKRPLVPPVVYLRQGDASGTVLTVEIFRDGEAFPLAGYTPRFRLRAPMDQGYYEVDGTASGNEAVFTIDETYAASYAGTTDTVYVQLLQGETVKFSTGNACAIILEDAEEGADPNGAYKSGITEAVEAANTAVERANTAAAAVEGATQAANAAAAAASTAAAAAEGAAQEVDEATEAARSAASSAQSSSSTAARAASSANAAAAMATEAADNATDMLIEVSDVTARAEQAIAGMGDISELAVPLMTEDVRGGAKVGQGLHVEDGSLSLGPLVSEGNPTHGCAIYGVSGEGWSEQRVTVGKNLAKPNGQTVVTNNGVTFTPTATGEYVLNGQATNTTSPGGKTFDCGILPAGTYIASATLLSGSSDEHYIRVGTGDNSSYNSPDGSYSSSVSTRVINADGQTRYWLTIASRSGKSFANAKIGMQLELGSTATDYEPHSGGLPSPRPDWEQPIEVCRGRNLLDVSIFAPSSSYYEVADDGTLTVKASDGRNWASVTKVQLAAGTYTVSRSNTSGTIKIRTSIDDYAADYLQVNVGIASATFTLSQDCDCAFKVGGSASSYPFTTTLQVESGTTPTPYVPYGCVGLEVTPKNLARPNYGSDKDGTFSGVTWTYKGDGVWHANGTSTSNNSRPANGTQTYIIGLLEAGTYVVSAKASDGSYVDAIVRTQTGNVEVASGTTPLVFTVEDGTDLRISPAIHYGTTIDADITLQLERGDTDTAWVPYVDSTCTPIPLPSKGWAGGLPDGTADALAVDSAGRWEWTSPVAEVQMTDSNITLAGVYPNQDATKMYVSSQGFLRTIGAEGAGKFSFMCDRLKAAVSYSDFYSTDEQKATIINAGKQLSVRLPVEIAPTLEDAQTWLASHPVTMLYELATPTTEHGYIDLPALTDGATVSCRELDSVGVSWFVAGAKELVEHAANWHRREDMASRLAALEATVAELATS